MRGRRSVARSLSTNVSKVTIDASNRIGFQQLLPAAGINSDHRPML